MREERIDRNIDKNMYIDIVDFRHVCRYGNRLGRTRTV
jgi:hypothetical protein